jgi:FMN-dependent NADH-azoreductase
MASTRHLAHGPEPHLITAELTLAHTDPAMAELIPLVEPSLAEAQRAIDRLWTPVPVLV